MDEDIRDQQGTVDSNGVSILTVRLHIAPGKIIYRGGLYCEAVYLVLFPITQCGIQHVDCVSYGLCH